MDFDASSRDDEMSQIKKFKVHVPSSESIIFIELKMANRYSLESVVKHNGMSRFIIGVNTL